MSDALKVSTTPRPSSRLAVEVEVPGDRCQACYDEAVTRLSRSASLPGFRRGRIPRAVLLQQIGPARIRASALEGLVESVWRDALSQASIEALGQPELQEGFDALLERFEPGRSLTITLELDVPPSPTLRTTRGLAAEAEVVEYDPARLEELIERSRRELATLVPVEDRPAASGDVAVVAFEGTYVDDGAPIRGGSSDALEVDLEEGRMIPGFVEGILGMATGETRTVTCRFPDDYPQEDARGREASFTITLKELKSRELPELDDAFARQASDKQTLAELRADLEQRLRDDAERRTRGNREEALLSALVEQLEVDLPETLIQQEIRSLIEQTAGQMAQQGMDVNKLFTRDLVRSLMDSSRPEAEQRLRRSLALKALAEAESIRVESETLESRLEEVRRELKSDAAIDEQRLREAVGEDLLREALLEWLEANATVRPAGQNDAPEPAAGTASAGQGKAAEQEGEP